MRIPFSVDSRVRDAYETCARITRDHYENFPVASLLLPRRQRVFLTAVYAFARGADDIADEGPAPPAERLDQLDRWEAKLDECLAGKADDPVFIALGDTMVRTGIPRQLLADLLTAFRMDARATSYHSFEDLLGYCRYSANPVGRIVLHLLGNGAERTMTLSDCICTALQLTNFWQDLSVDIPRGRIYLPLDDCDRFGYTERHLRRKEFNEAFRAMMGFHVRRTRELYAAGRPLVHEAGRDLRFELDLTWRGGTTVLDSIERCGYDVLHDRPTLSAADKLRILVGAVFRRER